jgi:5-(hydroxymethyl)furfural/furfural oxidase
MGMVSLRGTPADYAEWVSQGATDWAWEDVLPYFKKLETDIDYTNENHGNEGPIPIRRLPENLWPPLTKAIAHYARENNIPIIADQNADFRDGLGATPVCNTPNQRASTALMYLTPEVRKRPNLTMVHETEVEKILFEGKKAIGISVKNKYAQTNYYGQEILVCAGGIFSPAILMRSGIGDASLLNQLQIPVIAHRPGVGQNLQNHPILFIGFHLKKAARQSTDIRTHPSASLRYSSMLPNCPPADLYVNVQSKTSWNAMGMQIGNLASCVLRPKSVGNLKLKSPSSRDHPIVEFNFLQDPLDIERMMMAFTKAVEILACENIGSLMGTTFPCPLFRSIYVYLTNIPKKIEREQTD